MNLHDRITALRKQKGWSQNELAKRMEVSREIVGRYERGDALPSIDIAKRIAEAFDVSLDYLVGKSEQELDNAMLARILEVSKLPEKDKELVYAFLDAFINNSKFKSILQ
jgi:transcriptional regulator with XRE-family HTH domain